MSVDGMIFMSKDGGWKPIGHVTEPVSLTMGDSNVEAPYDLDLIRKPMSASFECEVTECVLDGITAKNEAPGAWYVKLPFTINDLVEAYLSRVREVRRLRAEFARKRGIGKARRHA